MKAEYAGSTKRDSGRLRFGVLQLPNLPWNEMVRRYLHLEELGFDIAGTGDHFANWSSPHDTWFELWTLLAAVAVKTERIRLGTWVTHAPFRRSVMIYRKGEHSAYPIG